MRKCNCGSGKNRFTLADAAGTFVAYVCEDCEQRIRSKYRADIFESGTRYAVTGEEEDIGFREDASVDGVHADWE